MTESQWLKRLENLLVRLDDDVGKHDEKLEDLVTECSPVSTWDEFQAWFLPFKADGCFRGHRAAEWKLTTTFYRKVRKTWMTDGAISAVDMVEPEENERALLRDFQRAAHHHYDVPPEPDEVVDWLALMQHHGAPTRMLDWTQSPYVALYFAMQEGSEKEAALWAIDLAWLKQRSNELLRKHDAAYPIDDDPNAADEYVNRILLNRDNPRIIVPASPKRLNERMLTQQGVLLCNLTHRPAFTPVLLSMLIDASTIEKQVVSRVIIKRDRRVEFLDELRRMNIHEASLFPGLDGFARSLGVSLDFRVDKQAKEQDQSYAEYKRSRKL